MLYFSIRPLFHIDIFLVIVKFRRKITNVSYCPHGILIAMDEKPNPIFEMRHVSHGIFDVSVTSLLNVLLLK
jgi:hypothetical protein